MERMLPRRNERMPAESRLLYGLAGGALLIFGMSRRSWLREPLALVGADLLSYGATGHHLYEALGITTGHAGTQEGTRIPHQLGAAIDSCECAAAEGL